jgi:hemolysin activation/secretion protein
MKFSKVLTPLLVFGLFDAGAQSLPKVDSVTPQLTNEAAPLTAIVAAPAITIKGIRIDGATLFKPEVLQALVTDVASGSHTLAELQAAAGRITQHYRLAGYFLARAYLPAQKLGDGVVTMAVLEGKLAETNLHNSSRLSDEMVRAHLSDLVPGTVLQRTRLDRSLLLLGDLPGLGLVDSRFVAGPNAGETVLDVVVNPVSSWAGKVEADNFGTLYSGNNRIGLSIEGNSPYGLGERLSANVMVSNENMVYGRAWAQLPVGYRGMTFGVGLSHSQYLLADIYKALDAVGQSNALEANVRYPLVRSVPFNTHVQAGVELRELRDEVRSTSTRTDKSASVLSLALHADWRDSLGGLNANSQASVNVTGGRLTIGTASAAEIDATAANTAGDYSKVVISASRQQGLTDKLSLSAQVRGQWANKNLDSSEKFSLGGAYGVRAYPSGEASGDKGLMGSLELRYAILQNLAASLFHDAGSITVNTNPYLSTSNKRSLSGSGVGLAGNYDSFDWRITLAWRNGDPSTSEPDKSPRLWAQAGWRF